MAKNSFEVFDENTNNVVEAFDEDSERLAGFTANNVIRSNIMNTVLRSATLITVALLQSIGYTSNSDDITIESSISDVVSFIKNNLTNIINVSSTDNSLTLTVGNNSTTITFTNATTADKLTTSRTITLSGAISGSGTFDGSTNLTIPTTITISNNSSNATVSFSINGTAFTTTVNNVANATNADKILVDSDYCSMSYNSSTHTLTIS